MPSKTNAAINLPDRIHMWEVDLYIKAKKYVVYVLFSVDITMIIILVNANKIVVEVFVGHKGDIMSCQLHL